MIFYAYKMNIKVSVNYTNKFTQTTEDLMTISVAFKFRLVEALKLCGTFFLTKKTQSHVFN